MAKYILYSCRPADIQTDWTIRTDMCCGADLQAIEARGDRWECGLRMAAEGLSDAMALWSRMR